EESNIPASGATTSTIRLTNMTYARKSDRSFAHTISSVAPDGSNGSIREVFDTVSNTYTVLEPTTKSKITYMYTAERLQKALNMLATETCDPTESINDAAVDEGLSAKYWHAVKHIPR